MKKLIIISAIIITMFISQSAIAIDLGSSDLTNAAKKAGYSESTSETSFAENIGFVIRLALSMVGVIFLGQMVYAGYLWMTAHGEEEQVTKAQTMIKQSIIGLIIVVGAYSITTYLVPMIVERVASGGNVVGQ